MDIKKKFLNNLSYAYVAQISVVLISIVTNLFLPKFLGVKNFDYWQLFLFYSQYLPFLHFGLNDGVYLRYGGICYEDMEAGKIKTQLVFGILFQLFLCTVLCASMSFIPIGRDRLLVILFACVYFLFFTVQNYLGFIFQAANETTLYSKSVILNRIVFLGGMLFAFVWGQKECWIYICGYIFAQAAATGYICVKGRRILCASVCDFQTGVLEVKESIRIGIRLMLANIASMLVVGCSRLIVDARWGLTAFGKVSFAVLLTNFILNFLQQISIVLFPALRQLKGEQQRHIYVAFREGLYYILPAMFVLFFPLRLFLEMWLPEYSESLRYLIWMLPMCFFDIKMQMLFMTYLKVDREEKRLCRFNVGSMIASAGIGLMGAYVFDSLFVVILGMVGAVVVRSILAERYLAGRMEVCCRRKICHEVLLSVIFVVVAWYFDWMVGSLVMLGCYAALLVASGNDLREWIGTVRKELLK